MSDDENLQAVPSGPVPSPFGSLPLPLPSKRVQVLNFLPLSPWIRILRSAAVSP